MFTPLKPTNEQYAEMMVAWGVEDTLSKFYMESAVVLESASFRVLVVPCAGTHVQRFWASGAVSEGLGEERLQGR